MYQGVVEAAIDTKLRIQYLDHQRKKNDGEFKPSEQKAELAEGFKLEMNEEEEYFCLAEG